MKICQKNIFFQSYIEREEHSNVQVLQNNQALYFIFLTLIICFCPGPKRPLEFGPADASTPKKGKFFVKEELSDSDEGEGCAKYAHKVCTIKPHPWRDFIKMADPNGIKEPDLDGTTSSDNTLLSLPIASQSSQPSLEDDDRETITISSDEDLEDSM